MFQTYNTRSLMIHLYNAHNLSPNGHSFRVAPGQFCRLDSYKSPGLRNALARWIHRLLKM